MNRARDLAIALALCWPVLFALNGAGVGYVGGGGDYTGPATSTDNALPRFDGTGGKTLQDSGWTLDDSDAMTAGGALAMGANNITLSASQTVDGVDVSALDTGVWAYQFDADGIPPSITDTKAGTVNSWENVDLTKDGCGATDDIAFISVEYLDTSANDLEVRDDGSASGGWKIVQIGANAREGVATSYVALTNGIFEAQWTDNNDLLTNTWRLIACHTP